MSKQAIVFLSLLGLVIAGALGVWALTSVPPEAEETDKLQVTVSILPQVTFVERLGGEEVEVVELVPPGASPATYEPSPTQILDLADSDAYFTVGLLPFEKANLVRIQENNPDLKIVNTAQGLPLRQLEAHTHGEEEGEEEEEHSPEELAEIKIRCEAEGGTWLAEFEECEDISQDQCQELGGKFDSCASACRHDPDSEVCIEACVRVCRLDPHSEEEHEAGDDPHVWLDPVLVKQQGEVILQTLIELRPEREDYFRQNYEEFAQDLGELDAELASTFEPFVGQTMLVYHPAFGYLADRYGFEQEHMEIPGKELSADQIQAIVDEAKAENIQVIFVQQQFDTRNAELIAREIGGQVVQIDPLAKDYFANLRTVARDIVGSES